MSPRAIAHLLLIACVGGGSATRAAETAVPPPATAASAPAHAEDDERPPRRANTRSKYWLRLEDLRLVKPPAPSPAHPQSAEPAPSAPPAANADPHGQPAPPPTPLEGTLTGGVKHRLGDARQRDSANGELRLKSRGMRGEVEFVAEARVRWDGSYAGRTPFGPQAHHAYAWDADWRELHLTAPLGTDWRATAGYQQLNWGRADNLRVLDQVNPLDLREHVLPEMEDSRIALPMLRLQGPLGDSGWHVDTFGTLRFQPHRRAVSGSEFDLQETAPLTQAGVQLLPEERPHGWSQGEQGLHLSRSFGALDLSLVAMNLRDRLPVYRLEDGATGLQARPQYPRQRWLGVGAAWASGQGWVWRGELAHAPRTVQSTARTPDGLDRVSLTSVLLGVDRAWRDWLFTAQASDRFIAGWQPGDVPPKHQPVVTLAATGNSLNARLESRLSCAWMLANGDGTLCQARLTYHLTDSQFGVVGADFFMGGSDSGFLGRFGAQDRIWLQLGQRF